MSKYLFTGGTGFIGTHYTNYLVENGHAVVILSRSTRKSDHPMKSYLQWDGTTIPEEVGVVDVLVNLAGAGIADKRWSEEWKKLVIESRVKATKACVEFINQAEIKPKVFLSGSAVGYYGAVREEVVDETSDGRDDFMGRVCRLWEEAAEGAETRTVLMRIGVVFGRNGGPLEVMKKPYKMFVGGPIASGKQGLPWIHIQDWIGTAEACIANENVKGPVNMVAPGLTKQGDFASALAKAMGRPNLFRVPKFALNILLGESGVIAWGGQFVKPSRLKKMGYTFKYEKIEACLKDLV